MNHCRYLVVIALACLPLCCAAAQLASTDDQLRKVTVNVSIAIPAQGLTLPEGFVAVMSGGAGAGAGRVYAAPIDAEGHARLTGEFPADVARVFVALPAIPPADKELTTPCSVPTGTRIVAAQRADKEFSLPYTKEIVLVPGMDTYTVTFTVPPAIVVRGRGVDSKQQILRTSVSRAGAINELWHRTVGGNFEIGGVPKSTDSWFFVARVASPMSKTIRLTTLQTAADVDLGNVVLPAAAGNTPVSLTCTGLDTVLEDDGLQRTYITLVGADASHVYSCAIGEAGLAQSEESGDQPLLPAGRYYVVPGLFCTSRSVHRLLDLLHAGKQASVDALGVPVIDAIPNQAITATVNVADAQDRIAGIRD